MSETFPITTQISGTTTFAFIYNNAMVYASDRRVAIRRAGDDKNIYVIASDDTKKIVHLTNHISITIAGNYIRGRTIVNYLRETIPQLGDEKTLDNIVQLTWNYICTNPPFYAPTYTGYHYKIPSWATLLVVGIDEYKKPRIVRLEDKMFYDDVPHWDEVPRAFEGSGATAAREMSDQLDKCLGDNVENMDIPQAIEYARKIVLNGCLSDAECGGKIDVSYRSNEKQYDVDMKVDELYLRYYSQVLNPQCITIFVLHSYRLTPIFGTFTDPVNNLEINSMFSSLPFQVNVNQLSIVRNRFVLKRVVLKNDGYPFDMRTYFGNYIKENPSRDSIVKDFLCIEYPCRFPFEEARFLTLYLAEESRATLQQLLH